MTNEKPERHPRSRQLIPDLALAARDRLLSIQRIDPAPGLSDEVMPRSIAAAPFDQNDRASRDHVQLLAAREPPLSTVAPFDDIDARVLKGPA